MKLLFKQLKETLPENTEIELKEDKIGNQTMNRISILLPSAIIIIFENDYSDYDICFGNRDNEKVHKFQNMNFNQTTILMEVLNEILI